MFFLTTAVPGKNLYVCATANMWTVVGATAVDSGSAITLGNNGSLQVLVGTTAGTVAAGNDLRLVNALQSSNNLGDVKNPAAALANLGLMGSNAFTISSSITGNAATASSLLPTATVPWSQVANVPVASGIKTGLISASDWATFSAKQPALGFTPLNPANNLAEVTDASAGRTHLGLGSAATQNATDFDAAGAAAAVQSSTLQKSGNLAELTDVPAARTNLGLGSAATRDANAFDAAGTAATVQALTLQMANNLADLTNSASARTNLGLGSAATRDANAFDAAGTAAAVQSSTLQKSGNLADLADASAARTNLGLGSAATRDANGFDAAGAAAAVQSLTLQKSGNLSDLTNPVAARTNLGLGSAATQNSIAFDAAGAATAVLSSSLQKTSNLSDLANPASALANLGGITSSQAAAAAPVQKVAGVSPVAGNIVLSSTNLNDSGNLARTTTSSLQAFSGSITAPNVNNVFYVDGFPASGCTVNGTTYTTQFDCAFATALAAATATGGTNTTLRLGNSVYSTCTGAQLPASYTVGVSLEGVGHAGSGSMGSKLRATCSMAAVVSHPDVAAANQWLGHWNFKSIAIDANNNAQSCVDVDALKDSNIEHISCQNATGSNAWFKIGGPLPGNSCPVGSTCSGFQVMVDDIFIAGNGNSNTGSHWAQVGVTQSGGVPSFTVNNGGSYVSGPSLQAYLIGNTWHALPCTTMGTLTVTTSGSGPYTVTGVTGSGFAGCAGTMYVSIPDIPVANYGFYTTMTDSTFNDVVVAGIGRSGSITANGGANTFVHAHAWQGPILFQDFKMNTWVQPEMDSPTVYGFDVEGNNTIISGAASTWNDSYPGARGFYLGGSNTSVLGATCSGLQNAGGYSEFAGLSGAFILSSPAFNSQTQPTNVTVVGAQQCVTGGTVINWIPLLYTGPGAYIGAYADSGNSTPAFNVGTGNGASNYGLFSNRALFGFDNTSGNAVMQGSTGKGVAIYVNSSTLASGTPALNVTSGGVVQMQGQKAATGTRYLCIDTAGNITSSSTACSGT